MSFEYNFKLFLAAGDAKVSNRYKTAIVLSALFMVISPRVQVMALQIMDVASNIEILKGNLINTHEFN